MQAQRLLIATTILAFSACKLWEPRVVCSDGTRCPDGTTCAADQDICITGPCGNGVMDEGELCDDGNIQSGDGCDSDCMSLERCGDGVKEEIEVCDDGNITSGDGCSSDCRSDEECGNGILDPQTGEFCDDGNRISLDNCRSDCMSLEICGDGVKDEILLEACDDGNIASGDGCSEDCRSDETCGNGVHDPQKGELCDPGSSSDGNGCSNDCLSQCGNGIVEAPEECDGDPGPLYCTSDTSYDMGRISCDIDNCKRTNATCVSFDFDYIQPTINPEVTLNAIWSDDNGNGYAVGNTGTIIRFGYEQSNKETVPDDVSEISFRGIWGNGMGQIYVVGDAGTLLTRGAGGWITLLSPNQKWPQLNSVWGYNDGDNTTVLAVGDNCKILRWDNNASASAWTPEDVPDGCVNSLKSISGNGPGQIYTVGSTEILHRSASNEWTELNGVDATSLDDIWVGGDGSLFIAKFIGSDGNNRIEKCTRISANALACKTLPYPSGEKKVWNIWGSSPYDLFAVTEDAIFHSNGSLEGDKWAEKFKFAGARLHDVHGSGPFDIFITSSRGVLHGTLPWRKMSSVPLNRNLRSVWADGTSLYAAGETGVFRLENDDWKNAKPVEGVITGLWGIDGSHLFAVGYSISDGNPADGHMYRYDGTEWTVVQVPPRQPLMNVWASDASNVFAVSGTGAIWHYRPQTGVWAPMAGTEPDVPLHDIWGSDMQNMFAVGSGGTILRYETARGEWVKENIPDVYRQTALLAIWGTDAKNVFAVGESGTILHYKGAEGGWEPMQGPTLATLYDIGGPIAADGQTKLFAAGYGGAVWYYDGIAWSDIRTHTTVDFDGIWVTPVDAFMVGDGGNTYRLRHDRIEIPSFE